MSIQKININGSDVDVEDATLRAKVGSDTLNTTSQVITTAINELHTTGENNATSISSINEKIGSGTLQTTDKTLIGAINEVKQSNVGSSGGGGGLPCIDTTNLIYEQNLVRNGEIRYTATEDCIMCLSLDLWGNGTYINVNNIRVFYANCGTSSEGGPSFMTLNLKRGDVFVYYPSGNSSNGISFKVFGIR